MKRILLYLLLVSPVHAMVTYNGSMDVTDSVSATTGTLTYLAVADTNAEIQFTPGHGSGQTGSIVLKGSNSPAAAKFNLDYWAMNSGLFSRILITNSSILTPGAMQLSGWNFQDQNERSVVSILRNTSSTFGTLVVHSTGSIALYDGTDTNSVVLISSTTNSARHFISLPPGPATSTGSFVNVATIVGNTAQLQYYDLFNGTNVFTGGTTVSSMTVAGPLSVLYNSPSSSYEFRTSTTSTYYHVAVSTNGHFNIKGKAPVASSCGTSPVVTGSDNAFTVTVGGTTDACTLTFAVPFNSTPTCVVTNQTVSAVNAMGYAVTNANLIISKTGLDDEVVDVMCIGRD